MTSMVSSNLVMILFSDSLLHDLCSLGQRLDNSAK